MTDPRTRRDARVARLVDGIPLAGAVALGGAVMWAFSRRIRYPFDLEWMEGGMLGHAWRLAEHLPLYPEAGPEWIPYVYPPGYPALLAALAPVVGLDYAPARLVSILGTTMAAGTLVAMMARRGEAALGVVLAGCFFGCWRASGAFFDLVRPDGLAIGLLGLTLALAVERRPRAGVAAGIALALAFVVKHHSAAFGVPLAIGLWIRDGWRSALTFGLAAAVPAGVFTLAAELVTDGRFLDYLIAVPASHPIDWKRVMPGTPGELGAWLLPSMVVVAGWLCVGRAPPGEVLTEAHRKLGAGILVGVWVAAAEIAWSRFVGEGTRFPAPLGGFPLHPWWKVVWAWLLPVFVAAAIGGVSAFAARRGRTDTAARALAALPGVLGIGLATLLLLDPVVRGVQMPPLPVLGGAGIALGASAGAGLEALLSRVILGDRVRGGAPAFWMAVAVGGTALLVALSMRGHYGGFLNVHIPAHFVILAGFGASCVAIRRRWPGPWAIGGTSALAAAQVVWIGAQLEIADVLPNDEDVAAGEAMLDMLRDRCPEGPILSPYAAWVPVQVGRPPSPHLITIWDINHPESPFKAGMGALTAAARNHTWPCVVKGGRQPIGFGIEQNYQLSTVFPGGPKAMMPKTGWRVRPSDLLVPRRTPGGGAE